MRNGWLVVAVVACLFVAAGCAKNPKASGTIPASFSGSVAVGYADPDFVMEQGLEGCSKEAIFKSLDAIALKITARTAELLSGRFKNITFKDVGDIDILRDPYEKYMIKKQKVFSTAGSQTMIWGLDKAPVCTWNFAVGINELPNLQDVDSIKYEKGPPNADYALVIWPISLFTFTSFWTSDSTGSFAYGLFETSTGNLIFGKLMAKEVGPCMEDCGNKAAEVMAQKVAQEFMKHIK
jgi:hypothetical protein